MAPYSSQQARKTFDSNTQNTSNNRKQYNRNTQDNRNFQNNRFASLQNGNPTGQKDNGRDNDRRDGKKPYYQKGDKSKRSDGQEDQQVQITFNTGKTATVTIPNDNPNNRPKTKFVVDDSKNQKPTYQKKDIKTDNQKPEEQKTPQQIHGENYDNDEKLQNRYKYRNVNKDGTLPKGKLIEAEVYKKQVGIGKYQTVTDGYNGKDVRVGRSPNPFSEYEIIEEEDIDKNGNLIIQRYYSEINRHPIYIIRQIRFTKTDKKTLQVQQNIEYGMFDIYSMKDTLQMIIAIPPKNVVTRDENGKVVINEKNIISAEDIVKLTPSKENNRYIASYIEDSDVKYILQQFARQSENTYIKGYSVFTTEHMSYMKDFVMERSNMFKDFITHIVHLNGGTLPQLSFTIPKFQEIYSRPYVVSERMFSIKVMFNDDYGTSRTYFFKAAVIEEKEKTDKQGNVVKDENGNVIIQRKYSTTNYQIYQTVAFSRDMDEDFIVNKIVKNRKITITKPNYSYTKVNRLRFIDFNANEYGFDKMYVPVEKVEMTDKNGKVVYKDQEIYQHDIANGTKNSFELREVDYNDTLFSSVYDIKEVNKKYVEFLLKDKLYLQRLFIRYVLLQREGLVVDDKFYTWNFFKYIPRQTQSDVIMAPGLTDSDMDRRLFDVSDVLFVTYHKIQFGTDETLPFFTDFRTNVLNKIEEATRYDVNYYSRIIMVSMEEFVKEQLEVENVQKMIKNIFDNWDRNKIYTKSALQIKQQGQPITIKDPYYPGVKQYQLYYIDPISLIGTEMEKKYYILFHRELMAKNILTSNYHMLLYKSLKSQAIAELQTKTKKTYTEDQILKDQILKDQIQKVIMNKFQQIDSYETLVNQINKQLNAEMEAESGNNNDNNNQKIDETRFDQHIVNSKIYNDKQKQQLYYMIYWLTYIYIKNTEWMNKLWEETNPVLDVDKEIEFIKHITPWVRFYKMFMLSLTVQNEYGGYQYFIDKQLKTLPPIKSFHSMFTTLDEVQKSLDVNMLKYQIVEKDIQTNYDKITLGFQNQFILPNNVTDLSMKSIITDTNRFYGEIYTIKEKIPQYYIANGEDYYIEATVTDYDKKPAETYKCIQFYTIKGNKAIMTEQARIYEDETKDDRRYLKIGKDEKKVEIQTDGTVRKMVNGKWKTVDNQHIIFEKRYKCLRYDHLQYIFGYQQMFEKFYEDATNGNYNGLIFEGIPGNFRSSIQTTIKDMFNLSPQIKYNIFKNTAIGLDYRLKPEFTQQVVFNPKANNGQGNLQQIIKQYQPSDTYDKFSKGENPSNNNNSNNSNNNNFNNNNFHNIFNITLKKNDKQ